MDLAVEFECGSCGTTCRYPVAALVPGRDRRCHRCGADQLLTENGLRLFREALESCLSLAADPGSESEAPAGRGEKDRTQ